MRGWVIAVAACALAGCAKNSTTSGGDDGSGDGGGSGGGSLAACAIFPSDHILNTPIADLPVDPMSSAYLSAIGSAHLHLDLGSDTDPTADDYYGIPYNVVHGNSMPWPTAKFYAPALDWDPSQESDCADASHAVVSPCTNVPVILPIPADPAVEGGLNMSADQTPDDDHHTLIVDADTCRLWEVYHTYENAGTFNIFGAATWDLSSDDLRPAGWTSTDAAGLPILPLLLRAEEADTGTIAHALRFTVEDSAIQTAYNWPARHDTGANTNTSDPPMGQLFRLKSSYTIPANYNTQAKAILTAMQTYGMYIADGGSSWYVTGEPSADWQDDTFDQVQSVSGAWFEAVDITAITSRSGFDMDSAKVPAP